MYRFIEVYSRFMDGLEWVIKVAVAIAVTIMTVVTVVEVVRRYMFGLSFVWAEELTRFLLVATTFLGGAAAYKIGGMACFDLLISKFGSGNFKFNKAIKIIDNLAIAAFCAYLAYNGFVYSFAPMVAKMKSPGLKLVMTVPYITIPIGFGIIVLFAIEKVMQAAVEKEGGARE